MEKNTWAFVRAIAILALSGFAGFYIGGGAGEQTWSGGHVTSYGGTIGRRYFGSGLAAYGGGGGINFPLGMRLGN